MKLNVHMKGISEVLTRPATTLWIANSRLLRGNESKYVAKSRSLCLWYNVRRVQASEPLQTAPSTSHRRHYIRTRQFLSEHGISLILSIGLYKRYACVRHCSSARINIDCPLRRWPRQPLVSCKLLGTCSARLSRHPNVHSEGQHFTRKSGRSLDGCLQTVVESNSRRTMSWVATPPDMTIAPST